MAVIVEYFDTELGKMAKYIHEHDKFNVTIKHIRSSTRPELDIIIPDLIQRELQNPIPSYDKMW